MGWNFEGGPTVKHRHLCPPFFDTLNVEVLSDSARVNENGSFPFDGARYSVFSHTPHGWDLGGSHPSGSLAFLDPFSVLVFSGGCPNLAQQKLVTLSGASEDSPVRPKHQLETGIPPRRVGPCGFFPLEIFRRSEVASFFRGGGDFPVKGSHAG